MIKKYAILTLILSLITTQSCGIIPESVSKNFSFFQDTKKSFFQRVMQYLQEKTGLSYAEEKEKRNQKDYFVEFNLQLIKEAEARNNSFLQKSPGEQEKICKNMLRNNNIYKIAQKYLDLRWHCFEDPEKSLRKIYQEIPELDLRKEILNSDNPDLARHYGWENNSRMFWDDLIMLKHCKECGYVNDDGSFNNVSVFKEDKGKIAFRENIEKASEEMSSQVPASDFVYRCMMIEALKRKGLQDSFSSYDLVTMLDSEYELLCKFVEKVIAGDISNVSTKCYATCEKIGTNKRNYTDRSIQENLLSLFNKSMEYKKFREFNGVFQEDNLIFATWSDICK